MPNINDLTYNGTNASSLGVYVTGSGTFNAPELDVTRYEVPGRNGDIILSNHRFKNIDVTYPAFIPNAFMAEVQSIRNWLRSSVGYARIEDTYDTTHYRMGIATELQEFSPVNQNRAANFQMVFNCKPQRYLKSGDTETAVTSGSTVNNTTQYTAKPLIKVVNPTLGATITLGSNTLTCVTAYTGTVYIDCETQNIYSGSNNLNPNFSGKFGELKSGNTTVTYSGVSSLTMKTRLWEL